MEATYSKRLSLLYALCYAETSVEQGIAPSANLEDYDPLEAANFLACYITFKAIQQAERSPADERIDNFDMLSVYQAFAIMVLVYLTLPLSEEKITPDFTSSAVTIARTLFAELSNEELAEIIDAGSRKFQLIGDAEQEHIMDYRQDLDKSVVAFIVAGTDEDAPYEKEDLLPIFGSLLSMMCEAFN
jgi:hypothetical protein